ncbi:hypothetical protein [Comamonas koreensis]|uniref:DUF2591 domain-containing protein n=1 Tax=Comamonas koreensis TaxID=160825 RepID=A0AAW4XZJ0_9BURK|nr:hypothetical protein [Comamonas koreensis]MCD2166855.1 hypothetical protein [Comamonas koreensis]
MTVIDEVRNLTDRQLLALVADACGASRYPETGDWEYFYIRQSQERGGDGLEFEAWNPLEDDGDALRLAVGLNIHIEQNTAFSRACALWYGQGVLRDELFEPWGNDKFAATRRAIVLAAAAIQSQATS